MAPWHWRILAASASAALVVSWTAGHAAASGTRPQGTGPRPEVSTGIVVNIPARTLYWYSDGELVRSFLVGVGKSNSETPVGSFTVETMAVDPWWLPPDGGPAVPPGPDNPLGTRWIGFWGSYGIHGNNNPASIGHQVSLGCVRMYVPDVEWLYEQVSIGTPVEVIYEPVLLEYGPAGQRYLAVYPDGYGKGGKDPEAVLNELGLPGDAVQVTGPGWYLLDASAVLNGVPLEAVIHQSRPYVHAHGLGAALFASVEWDQAAGQVQLEGTLLPTTVRDGVSYVAAAEAAAVLGLQYQWQEDQGLAVLQGVPRYLEEGRLFGRTGTFVGTDLPVPLLVAEGLSRMVETTAGALAHSAEAD